MSKRRPTPLPTPELRDFLDAFAAMLVDAVLRDEAEAAKAHEGFTSSHHNQKQGGRDARHATR